MDVSNAPSIESNTTVKNSLDSVNPFDVFPSSSDALHDVYHSNTFEEEEPMEMHLYLSSQKEYTTYPPILSDTAEKLSFLLPVVSLTNISYAYTEEVETIAHNITLPMEMIENNVTCYLHIYFVSTKKAGPTDERKPLFSRNHSAILYSIYDMTILRPKETAQSKKKLLSGGKENPTAAEPSAVESVNSTIRQSSAELTSKENAYIRYWKPSLRIHPVVDFSIYRHGSPAAENTGIPLQQVGQYYTQLDGVNYKPIVYLNEFWSLSEQYKALTGNATEMPIEIQYYPMTMTKFLVYTQIALGFQQQQANGMSQVADIERMKTVLLTTNIYFLLLTVIITILHSIFDFLAFKNDISFWKGRDDYKGLSLRSVGIEGLCHTIIFLYLLDNEENTSYMILLSQGIGLFIDYWKIWKCWKAIQLMKHQPVTHKGLCKEETCANEITTEFEPKPEQGEMLETRKHDEIAVLHLCYVVFPLLAGYAIYSLYYNEYKSWYSWAITSCTRFVYLFGFILMTPQLYINYRLKSVAHLPWKVMIYKSLNTVIDDLFAFIFPMPWLHRLACFRDDLIFCIFLYQKWIYPTDKKRTNEYGQCYKEKKNEKEIVQTINIEKKQC